MQPGRHDQNVTVSLSHGDGHVRRASGDALGVFPSLRQLLAQEPPRQLPSLCHRVLSALHHQRPHPSAPDACTYPLSQKEVNGVQTQDSVSALLSATQRRGRAVRPHEDANLRVRCIIRPTPSSTQASQQSGPSGKQSMTWCATSRARVVTPTPPGRPPSPPAAAETIDQIGQLHIAAQQRHRLNPRQWGQPAGAAARGHHSGSLRTPNRTPNASRRAPLLTSEGVNGPERDPSREREHRLTTRITSPRLGGSASGIHVEVWRARAPSSWSQPRPANGSLSGHSPKPVAACFGLWSRSGRGAGSECDARSRWSLCQDRCCEGGGSAVRLNATTARTSRAAFAVNTVFDETSWQWISRVEVAEIAFTAFAAQKPHADPGQSSPEFRKPGHAGPSADPG